MRLADLAGRHVALWGPGREGLGMARLLAERAPAASLTFLADDVEGVPPATRRAVSELGGTLRAIAAGGFAGIEVLVRSPGVSCYRPELGEARRTGVALTTLTALWLADHRHHRVVGVTGTKGKSTTAALIAHLLEALGVPVALAGNIGRPLTELYRPETPPGEVYVVEVSSYQAADVADSPPLGVVTLLAPEHLPWHANSLDRYVRDKLNLLAHREDTVSVLNAESPLLREWQALCPNPVWYADAAGIRVADGQIADADGPLLPAGAIRLPGRFNLVNACGALTTLAALGWSPRERRTEITAALGSFHGLPGRHEIVAETKGLLFVDDALACNPTATVAALRVHEGRPVTLLVGGEDRGLEFGELVDYLEGLRPTPRLVVVADGDLGTRLDAELTGLTVETVPDVAAAVARATETTPAGGVVLFAPAAPTPARLGSFEDRSRDFRAAVAGLDSGS